MEKARIKWIDIAKGLVILMVIIGHLENETFTESESIVRAIIFSFHMPFFFLISSYCSRYSSSTDEFGKRFEHNARKLLPPALVVFIIGSTWGCINYSIKLDYNLFLSKMYSLLYASGVTLYVNDMSIEAMGMPWFFIVLFLGMTIFDYEQLCFKDKNQLLIISIVTGLLGIVLGNVLVLPFSFDVALAIIPFFYVGQYLRKIDLSRFSAVKLWVSALIWGSTLYIEYSSYEYRTYLELAARRYYYFPLCYITAIAGCIFVIEVSLFLSNMGKAMIGLEILGKNSMYLFCIHALDQMWKDFWYVPGVYQYKSTLLRLIYDLIIFIIFLIIKKLVSKMWQFRPKMLKKSNQ